MEPYHLEVLDIPYCNNDYLIIFSRAHMSYINQIFGDETIRDIIQEVFPMGGKLVIEAAGANFEHSVHHVYYYDADESITNNNNSNNNSTNSSNNNTNNNSRNSSNNNTNNNSRNSSNNNTNNSTNSSNNNTNNSTNSSNNNTNNNSRNSSNNNTNNNSRNSSNNNTNNNSRNSSNNNTNNNNTNFVSSKICSVNIGYQDLDVDVNDTLCQSYSLMAYLEVPFDSTPSRDATTEMKFQKQLAMINMYRMILENENFLRELDGIIKDKRNKKLWEDTVDEENPFFMIERFKSTKRIVKNINTVLDIWENYGWHFFVGDGKCEKVKKNGGARKTRRKTIK